MQQTEFFAILDHFLPFYPPNDPKNQNFEKMKKKRLEISSFYTSVPKIMIICYTVPEIWRVTDVIFIFHFGHFLPFYLPNDPKNQHFEKMKKRPGDINILHMCTKNYDHDVQLLRYGARRTDGRTDGKSDI